MSIEVKHWCACEECDGSGKVWRELKGANVLTTETCGVCWGFGRVLRYMTKAEKKAMAEQILKESA